MVRPYRKYALVAAPFGLTEPFSVALVAVTPLAAIGVALGFAFDHRDAGPMGFGHGFGLHSAANAMRALGGELRASSDGPGHGAGFAIELPLRVPVDTDALAEVAP